MVLLVLAIVLGGIFGYEYAVVHLHHSLGMTQGRPPTELRPWRLAPWACLVPMIKALLSAGALRRDGGRRRHLAGQHGKTRYEVVVE